MNVLAIGNSFSEDATRYLHQIAKAQGTPLTVVNLVIGGCSLERHYRCMLGASKDYILFFNGENTGFHISLEEALLSRQFDVITLQQASHFSFRAETFTPYLAELVDYVRTYQPQAKVYFHETWAYEDGSDRLHNLAGFDTMQQMTNAIHTAVATATAEEDIDGIIPSGALMQALSLQNIGKVHRDTFHAGFGFPRYALGLLWFKMLTGKTVAENAFSSLDEPATPEQFAAAKAYVDALPPLV